MIREVSAISELVRASNNACVLKKLFGQALIAMEKSWGDNNTKRHYERKEWRTDRKEINENNEIKEKRKNGTCL